MSTVTIEARAFISRSQIEALSEAGDILGCIDTLLEVIEEDASVEVIDQIKGTRRLLDFVIETFIDKIQPYELAKQLEEDAEVELPAPQDPHASLGFILEHGPKDMKKAVKGLLETFVEGIKKSQEGGTR